MGIVDAPKSKQTTPSTAKRKSTDFSMLGPLKKSENGPLRYSSYRDTSKPAKKSAKDEDAMESDDEDDERQPKVDDDEVDVQDANGQHLSPEDARKQGELAEGVTRMKVSKNQHHDSALHSLIRISSNVRILPNLSVTPGNLRTSTRSIPLLLVHHSRSTRPLQMQARHQTPHPHSCRQRTRISV